MHECVYSKYTNLYAQPLKPSPVYKLFFYYSVCDFVPLNFIQILYTPPPSHSVSLSLLCMEAEQHDSVVTCVMRYLTRLR